jgi:hypothetical protein
MPVYTLNPSHTRSGTHKASPAHSLRERMTLRRNSASSADGSETYYPTSSSSSSSSSSSTQRSRAATSAATAVANAQARRYAAEASGYMGNPRAKTPTRKDELMRFAHDAGYHVETYSPGDGVTRYRFFDLAEMDRKGVSMREMSYFGPLNGVDTVLGLAAAKKWLSKSHTRRHNPLSEDGMTVSNPKRPRYKVVAVAKPRSRSGGTAQKAGLKKGQSLMARAAAAYRAGEYASMQDALRGVARKRNPLIPVVLLPPTPPPKKTLRGAPVENPRRKGSKSKAKRSSGRTVAQSNAARAMKLFHSGQASSLAEAWDIIRSGR